MEAAGSLEAKVGTPTTSLPLVRASHMVKCSYKRKIDSSSQEEEPQSHIIYRDWRSWDIFVNSSLHLGRQEGFLAEGILLLGFKG